MDVFFFTVVDFATKEGRGSAASRSAKTSIGGIGVRFGALLVVAGRPIAVAAQNLATASLLASNRD